jgi:anhydro-N-acetylmuramic acid kinase
MNIIGLMSGTSLDGVDAALLKTDGERVEHFGPGIETRFESEERRVLQCAVDAALEWRFEGPQPAIFDQANEVLTCSHSRAVRDVFEIAGLRPEQLDAVGFHGQTVLHIPPVEGQLGRTLQLGDGQALANELGCRVVYDFRQADMMAGGHGAPLAPVYHRVLVEHCGLPTPIGLLNIGGVANLTLIDSRGQLTAFDTGPGNGLMDAWVLEKTGQLMDVDGALAASGKIHQQTLSDLLAHPHFKIEGPKSLDRWDFSLDHARNLSVEDGVATLSEFTALAISDGLKWVNEAPKCLVACGGGRKNSVLLSNIEQATGVPVWTAEQIGWRGDLIEAEAFAVLAARKLRDLPISFPDTTGVQTPLTGGVIAHPKLR